MKLHPVLNKYHQIKARLQEDLQEGVLYFSPQSEESYEEEGIKKEGHSAEDVTGYWWPSLKEYFQINLESYASGLELYQESIRKPKTPEDHVYNLLRFYGHTLKRLILCSGRLHFPPGYGWWIV